MNWIYLNKFSSGISFPVFPADPLAKVSILTGQIPNFISHQIPILYWPQSYQHMLQRENRENLELGFATKSKSTWKQTMCSPHPAGDGKSPSLHMARTTIPSATIPRQRRVSIRLICCMLVFVLKNCCRTLRGHLTDQSVGDTLVGCDVNVLMDLWNALTSKSEKHWSIFSRYMK